MKTSARFLAMLLAVVMIAGAALSATAFDDVAGNKHANAINVLAQLGVIGGYEDGTFKPDQKVTRAEMAKLVYVLYTTFVDAGTGATAFTDVAADNWATGYINWCSQKGIIGGYGDGKFGPNDNVTYDQALKMVCGVLGYTDFQSNLWPTDVRMTALRTLALGEELDDVKGSEQLTRAQVAQIMYNALDEDMNEKKTVSVPLGDTGYTVPVDVAKTLAVDIWKFDEVTLTVDGTENYGADVKEDEIHVTGKYTDKDGKEVTYNKAWKLADYGLEKYADKTDALYGLEVIALKNAKDEILSATVAGSVVDGVEVKYNAKAETVLVIGGVEYTYDEKAPLYTWDYEKTPVNAFTKTEDKNGKEIYVVADTIVKALDDVYMARAIDVDGDGVIDRLVLAGVTFYKVGEVKKNTDKTVVLNDLADKFVKNVKSADLTTTVAKDDVIAIANLGGINYTTIIEGVETYATKLAANDNKLTLADGTVVEYAEGKIVEDAKVMLGDDNKKTYYIYNGEIVLVDGIDVANEYKVAILKDVIKHEAKYNPDTKKYETFYNAILVINGEDVEVKLSSNLKKDVLTIGEKTYNADEAAKAFGTVYEGRDPEKNLEADGSLKYNYILLSSYSVDEDDNYTLVADKAMGEDDIFVAEGTISYDADKKLYTVVDTKNTATYNKVVLDANSVIYYTFKDEDETGDFVDLDSYTKETITTKTFDEALAGGAYLVYNEANKTYTLVAAKVAAAIEGIYDGEVTYKNDGTLILYAPAGSSEFAKGGKYYYEYTFKKGLESEVVLGEKETKDSTPTVAGGFYALDDDKYVKISSRDSFLKATLNEIFTTDNGYNLDYNDKQYHPISDDVTIWGLAADEDGKTEGVYDEYKEISAADLSAMLDEAKENKVTIEAYLVRTLNQTTDKWELKEIIVNIYETNEETEKFEAINANLFPVAE